jgi:hypothetical protein
MTEEHGNDGAGRVRKCATGRLSERSTEFKLKRTKLEAELSQNAGRASHQRRNESPSCPCTRHSRCRSRKNHDTPGAPHILSESSIIDRQDAEATVGPRPRRVRITPVERVVARRLVVARRRAVADVAVAALAPGAVGAAGRAAVVVLMAASRVDGDVALAGVAVAVAEGGHGE